ncbi:MULTISPECIES: ABC transporter ATP-binding protein [Bacillaceae]|uniref:ABC transporter ATP-binding protein n=1 Tax=Evansella alkalicola TaxID=745819 RepID=A0ABS6JNE8_9BACI|nr:MULTISPECIES: ABC transporter ATP-binding protein [Bacillaceae]MBU9720079.1 ABC transporter ATP-binding protein [Bacillus alkalicola]
MEDFVLEVEGLTKTVKGNKKIVNEMSFQMKRGEILGLLGPNGAGKTTTIRMLVGLIGKTAGKVVINGKNLDVEGQRCKEDIGAIVENPAFYEHISGFKNLQQYARMARQNITTDRLNEVVQLVKLEHAIHDKVKTYSLGMKQRLGVAQAIIHKPAVLILDEPTNGLDPQGIRDLRDYLKVLAKEGTSTLVSSHLLSEMQLMCDRVVIMERGKVIDVTEVSNISNGSDSDNKSVLIAVTVAEGQSLDLVLDGASSNYELMKTNGNVVTIKLAHDKIPELNRFLVKKGIDVFGIEIVKTTLEDRFLQVTNLANEG